MESAKSRRAEENTLRTEGGKERWTADLSRYLNENLHTGELDPTLIPGKYQNLVNSWEENRGPNGGDQICLRKTEKQVRRTEPSQPRSTNNSVP